MTPDRALSDTERVDALRARGEDAGPLAGAPIAIKDLVALRGARLIGGSPAYEDFVADENDVVVERLQAADAIIVGLTNVPEFG